MEHVKAPGAFFDTPLTAVFEEIRALSLSELQQPYNCPARLTGGPNWLLEA